MPAYHLRTPMRCAVQVAIWGLFIAGCVAISPERAVADRIDDALLDNAPKLIEELQGRGYKKVGVLTFLLQQGDKPSQFRGATICNTMPARLESSLILKMSSEKPELMILPQASKFAAKQLAGASYRSPQERSRLFNLSYPQAWGNGGAITADAFLVGKIAVAKDKRDAVVSIAAFDREKMFDILEFNVKVDRYMLADMGQGFSLTKTRPRGTKLRGMTDDAIFDSVDRDTQRADGNLGSGQGNDNPNFGNDTNPDNFNGNGNSSGQFPVELTVYYDGQPQGMLPDSYTTGSNNYSLPEPQEGQKLTFGLKNTTNNRLCAVLLVNGANTLYQQVGQPSDMNKWILEPGEEYRVKGYHQLDGGTYLELTTLSDRDSRDKYEDLGGDLAAGLIHLYVFSPLASDDNAVLAYTRSVGRLSSKDIAGKRFASFATLQQAIHAKSNLKGVKKGLAGPGNLGQEMIVEKNVGPVRLSDTMIVRYSTLRP